MHGEDLLDAPMRHGVGHQHGARYDLVLCLACTFDRRPHFADCEPARRCDSPLHYLSRLVRAQPFRSVIRLFRPLRVGLRGEFQTTSVHDVQLAVLCAQDNEGRPPGVSLQPKGYFHRAKSSPNP